MMTDEISADALPAWMQRTLRGPDWGALISLAFSVIVAWSFIVQPGLPGGGVAEAHVYRAAEYATAIREGRLYPRWSATANGGYGAPIPHYIAPGAAYPPALIDTLLIDDPLAAVRITFAGALVMAGAAAYAFARRRVGALAGLVTALLYVYSPYVGLTTPYIQGDLPSVIGHALLPLLLLSADRLLSGEHPFDFLYVAFSAGYAVLTDPQMAGMAIGMSMRYALWRQTIKPTRHWRALLVALTLGVGISACYWLPALIEADAVMWQTTPPLGHDKLRWFDLLAAPRALDPAALMPAPQYSIGLAALICVVLALPMITRTRDGFRGLFLLIAIALSMLAVIHDRVWLLGGAMLGYAIAGSGVIVWAGVLKTKPRIIGIAAMCLALVMAFPLWMLPERPISVLDTSLSAQIAQYNAGFGVVALPPNAPLPTTLSELPMIPLPPGGTPLTERIASARAVQIGVLEARSHGFRAQVQSGEAATITLMLADFPGWQVRFIGAPTVIATNPPGLITVSFSSAVRGELIVSLEPTPPRLLAWAITWGALLLTFTVTIIRTRRASPVDLLIELLDKAEARVTATLMIGCAVLMITLTMPGALETPNAPFGADIGGFALDSRSDVGLETVAFDVDRIRARYGDDVRLTLYWQALRFLNANYHVRLSLLNLATGDLLMVTADRQPAGFPTGRWLPRRYLRDNYFISLSPEIAAGEYSPALEVYACGFECASNAPRISFFDARGNPYGQLLVLPVVITISN